MKTEEIEKQIEDLETEIEHKTIDLNNIELDPDDYEEEYKEMLNDVSGDVQIGSLKYDAAYVLKEVDPTAYQCGLNDYINSKEISETDEYKEIEQEIADLESELITLEEELDELDD